jgi:hypothetical protein
MPTRLDRRILKTRFLPRAFAIDSIDGIDSTRWQLARADPRRIRGEYFRSAGSSRGCQRRLIQRVTVRGIELTLRSNWIWRRRWPG